MDISAVITQLRTYCPSLKLVGGAADFSKGLETTVNPSALPAAYVLPDGDEAEENTSSNALFQQVKEKIAVIVEFDNSGDRRGFASANQVETMKYNIFAALLNWRIDPIKAQRGLEYLGGEFVEMDRARLWWSYRFELTTSICDEDGFPLPSEDFTRVRVDIELEPSSPAPTPTEPLEVDVFIHPPQTFPDPIDGVQADTNAGILVTTTS